MRFARFAVAVGAGVLVVACREPMNPINEGIVIEAVTAQTTGVVGEFTESPPAVIVTRESDGRPFAGVLVIFSPVNVQGGAIGAFADTTDGSGIATGRTWRLGPRTGLQQINVYAPRYVRATVLSAVARAGPVAGFSRQTSAQQFALTGRQPVPPSVRVTDRYNNGIEGLSVAFAATPGNGALEPASVTTNSSGYASATAWNLPTVSGTYSAVATFGSSHMDFTAQRVDSSALAWFALDSLTQGTRSYAPAEYNIKSARLGLSPFDPCLCVNLDGAFFEIFDHLSGSSLHSEHSGSLMIANGKMSLEFVDSVKVTPTSVLIKRSDYYYNTFTTYVYKRKP